MLEGLQWDVVGILISCHLLCAQQKTLGATLGVCTRDGCKPPHTYLRAYGRLIDLFGMHHS